MVGIGLGELLVIGIILLVPIAGLVTAMVVLRRRSQNEQGPRLPR